MFLSLPLLLIAIASLPVGDVQRDRVVSGPYELRARVLDVFEGNHLLLSIGTDQGVRKGLKGYIFRTHPEPVAFSVPVEFVEVGAKHSLVRVQFYLYGLHQKARRLQENDSVVWYSLEPRPIPELPRLPGYMQRGGAIIDLTSPNGPKLLPRKE
jgi:hypothetical protein